jgi:predicted DNA-binding protein (MmcQ/YjbR family)
MNLDNFRRYCLSLKHATEDFPFDETTLCFRIGGKIFAMTDTERIPFHFNLKCDPEWAVELREHYACIIPGYHCNKKHWNTVEPDVSLEVELIQKMIDHSYHLVFESLKKAEKIKLI